jgi:hypothetical protein
VDTDDWGDESLGTQSVRDKISSAFSARAKILSKTLRAVKAVSLLVGPIIMGVVSIFLGGQIWPLSALQLAGLFGAVLALAGGIVALATEGDEIDRLDEARQAYDIADSNFETSIHLLEELTDYELSVDRLKSLYFVLNLGRGVLERAIDGGTSDEVSLIDACLLAVQRDLLRALEFNTGDICTIGVYKVRKAESGLNRELHCISAWRSEPCDLQKARVWPEGVGVAGVALSKNDEVVMPDLTDVAAGTAFRLEKPMLKDHDTERYKSLFAVPVTLKSNEQPWGVVIATCDTAGHFGLMGRKGVDPEEAVRAFAGLVALCVASCKKKM